MKWTKEGVNGPDNSLDSKTLPVKRNGIHHTIVCVDTIWRWQSDGVLHPVRDWEGIEWLDETEEPTPADWEQFVRDEAEKVYPVDLNGDYCEDLPSKFGLNFNKRSSWIEGATSVLQKLLPRVKELEKINELFETGKQVTIDLLTRIEAKDRRINELEEYLAQINDEYDQHLLKCDHGVHVKKT